MPIAMTKEVEYQSGPYSAPRRELDQLLLTLQKHLFHSALYRYAGYLLPQP